MHRMIAQPSDSHAKKLDRQRSITHPHLHKRFRRPLELVQPRNLYIPRDGIDDLLHQKKFVPPQLEDIAVNKVIGDEG